MDSTQDVWDGLSDVIKSYLSRSVASIALRDGDYMLLVFSIFQQIYIETPPIINDFLL